ncbi:MAG: DUF4337 family protein [Pedosphaera sp.]|nr:DUF4337 family protein [Pedosphaera sp.]
MPRTRIKESGDQAKSHAKIAEVKNETFDRAEILLQIALVLCSLTLRTGFKLFTRVGFAAAAAGIAFGVWAYTRNDVLQEAGHKPAAPDQAVSTR